VPGPPGGAYSAPPDPLAAFDGHTSKRWKGWGVKWKKGEGRKGKGRKKGVDATHPLWKISSYATGFACRTFQLNGSTCLSDTRYHEMSTISCVHRSAVCAFRLECCMLSELKCFADACCLRLCVEFSVIILVRLSVSKVTLKYAKYNSSNGLRLSKAAACIECSLRFRLLKLRMDHDLHLLLWGV